MVLDEFQVNVMLRQGLSYQKIASSFGVTRQAVHALVKRKNLVRPTKSTKKNKEKKEKPRAWKMFLSAYGCMPDQADHIPKDALYKYRIQKSNARVRGVSWQFDLLTWWDVWQKSGHWEKRGKGEGYCMGRFLDKGPYHPENVYICTVGKNFSDYQVKKTLQSLPVFDIQYHCR